MKIKCRLLGHRWVDQWNFKAIPNTEFGYIQLKKRCVSCGSVVADRKKKK